MRRLILFVVLALVASMALAQDEATATSVPEISHGVLAQLLLDAIATKEPPHLAPEAALERAKEVGILPDDWKTGDTLTQAEMASVLRGLCPDVTYQPGDPDAGLSEVFAAALIRRVLSCIRHTLAARLGHGSTSIQLGGNVAAAPVPVSPSGF